MTSLFHLPLPHGHSPSAPRLPSRPEVIAARLGAAWRNWQARREMESLPYDLRKDIGFRSPNTRVH